MNINTNKLKLGINEIKKTIGTPTYRDYYHILKLDLWCLLFIVSGLSVGIVGNNFATTFIGSVLFSIGAAMRFIVVGHTVMHGAYDSISNVFKIYQSNCFGKGWRRYIDMYSFIDTEAWIYEHNKLHHGNVGTIRDPDSPITKFKWLKNKNRLYQFINILYHATISSFTYYAKETIRVYNKDHDIKKSIFMDSIFPHMVQMLALLALFAFFGVNGILFMLISEVIISMLLFFIVSATHTGNDVYYFTGHAKTSGDRLLREILGTVNYTGGSDIKDFFNGFLGYHIEHHVLPGETNLFYQKAQPMMEQLCKEHGIPYKSEPLYLRIIKLMKNYMWIETPKKSIYG